MMNRLALAAIVSLISFSAPVMAQTQEGGPATTEQQMQQSQEGSTTPQDGSATQQEKQPAGQ